MDARIFRLERYMQQSATLMESILRRLDTPPVALTGGDEQLTALQEVAPMTLERRPGGNADDVRRALGAAMASAARRGGRLDAARRTPAGIRRGGHRVQCFPQHFS